MRNNLRASGGKTLRSSFKETALRSSIEKENIQVFYSLQIFHRVRKTSDVLLIDPFLWANETFMPFIEGDDPYVFYTEI